MIIPSTRCINFQLPTCVNLQLPMTLAAKGEIPAFKVGGVWRFRRSEIDQWIADQTQVSTKKEVMRKREQQKSAEQDLSQLRNVRRSRRTN